MGGVNIPRNAHAGHANRVDGDRADVECAPSVCSEGEVASRGAVER